MAGRGVVIVDRRSVVILWIIAEQLQSEIKRTQGMAELERLAAIDVPTAYMLLMKGPSGNYDVGLFADILRKYPTLDRKINSPTVITRSLEKLLEADLICKFEARIAPSVYGMQFLDAIINIYGADLTGWPDQIPVQDGIPDWGNSIEYPQ